MSNINQLRKFIQATDAIIEPARRHTWTRPTNEQYFAFLQRSVVVRQWEALHALAVLSDSDSAHFGVTLLRPAYEELIWIEYLVANSKDANRIVLLWAQKTISDSVTEQAQYLGGNVVRKLGWSKREVGANRRAANTIKAELATVGKRLGWPGTRIPPSFKWVSKQVGRANEYNFIYHATSSYVHFSPHELMRRVWGQHGTVSVSSSHFADYWAEFAAYWAIRTFVETLAALSDTLLADSREVDDAMLGIIEELRPVPIITPEELQPWPEP